MVGSAALLVLVPLASAARYGQPAEIPLGAQPVRIAVSDATQDSLPDVLTANASAPAFTLLRGEGGGRFDRPLSIAGPVGARAVVFGDFDGDGGDDLAVAAPNAIVIYVGAGGTLGRGRSYPVQAPRALETADFDNDGNLDLAVTRSGFVGVAVMRGEGAGTFQPPTEHRIGTPSSSLLATDLNGDDIPDLVAAGGGVNVLIGRGDGTFAPSQGSAGIAGVRSLAAGDLDLDDDIDLVAAGGVNTAWVLLNEGDGTFGNVISSYRVGGTPAGIVLDEVDEDASPDILTANRGTNDVSILLGRGDGTFGPQSRIRVGRAPVGLRLEDLNSDGYSDLVVANGKSKSVSVLLKFSNAPQPTVCLVPRVVGRQLAVARGLLSRAHCTVGQIRRAYSRRVRRNRVIAQSPVPRVRAPQGAPVALVVSRGPRR